MPSQVIGIIEAADAPWRAIFEPTNRWHAEPTEEIEADLERLQADLIEEWTLLRARLGNL